MRGNLLFTKTELEKTIARPPNPEPPEDSVGEGGRSDAGAPRPKEDVRAYDELVRRYQERFTPQSIT